MTALSPEILSVKIFPAGYTLVKIKLGRRCFLMPLSLPETQVKFNTKVKVYPSGYTNTTYCSVDIFRNPDYEKRESEIDTAPPPVLPPLDPTTELYAEHTLQEQEKRRKHHSGEIREDNLKRARERIFDIVLLNDFKYFITGTFAENEDLDRTDPKEVIKPLLQWFKHQVQRRGLQYVLVAERHKKNGIHIHALVNDVLPLVYSGRRLYKGKAWNEDDILKEQKSFERYKKIYNIDNWRFGWSTAIKCDRNKLRLARYVTKYITKEQKKIFGKYYWSSKNIEREPKTILLQTKFDDVAGQECAPAGTSYRFKYDAFFNDDDKLSEMLADLNENTDSIIEYLAELDRIQSIF